MPTMPSPLVIGGVAGSGTRVYRSIAQLAGYELLGAPSLVMALRRKQDDSYHDNLFLRRFYYHRAIDRYRRRGLEPTAAQRLELRAWLWASGPLKIRSENWGWKNPLALLTLPLIAEAYPGATFLHVVRDVRDVAFDSRHTLLERGFLLEPDELRLPESQQFAIYWERANSLGAADAQRLFNGRYFVSRWESLLEDPFSEIARVVEFLGGAEESGIRALSETIRTPSSAGRWRQQSVDDIAVVEQLAEPFFSAVGYQPMRSE